MKVIVSAAISIDGYLDDCSAERLRLSCDQDWAEVHKLRARCDAILVGAGTLRSDNPSLMIDDEQLRQFRVQQGMPADITKVTLSSSGKIDTCAKFFVRGNGRKIVFTDADILSAKWRHIATVADVVSIKKVSARSIVENLEAQGYKTLMVEGGSRVLTMFFCEGMVDEFRLAVAPFFVGEKDAPRLVGTGSFFNSKECKMKLERVEMVGGTAVIHYTSQRK